MIPSFHTTFLKELLAALAKWLEALFHYYALKPPPPPPFTLTIRKVNPMATVFEVIAHLPVVPVSAPTLQTDVVSQALTATINGAVGAAVNIPLGQADFSIGNTFAVGDVVSASLQYMDAAGGVGAVRVETVTVTAPLVPAQPGDFALEVRVVS